LERAGMVISGLSPDGRLVEMVELPSHPFFIGCQFHPEFKSRPSAPAPLFQAFVKAALENRAARGKDTAARPQQPSALRRQPDRARRGATTRRLTRGEFARAPPARTRSSGRRA